ncbi:hypothetical protein EBN03_03450 [Nocardia stercoris]|uniref:Beta-ketoacyl-[acyl-carrier-protein] synthase III N-terminal domain-containing protein n=2 Tax=Nocardia stercoris TaxID=2483361 RepID=A0A3M2LCS8_9NOCA|nr:hypothetical protein EBN03_03450 [Nocardia stercoris]
MGVVISAATTRSGGTSSIGQAADAAVDALAGTGPDSNRVDALINVGVYRDSNMVEPAVSALIQQRAGIGLEYRPGGTPCLSFDLTNGACGFVNAIGVAQALFATEVPRHANPYRVLIVSGDTHPSCLSTPEFPITPVGAAVVLEEADSVRGFGPVRFSAGERVPEPAGYLDLARTGSAGRKTITADRFTTPPAAILEHAVAAAREAVTEAGLDPAATVLVCNQPYPEFPRALADALRITEVVRPETDTHTSALTVGYLEAARNGLRGRAVLFVAADAGPTAAAVGYHAP